MNCLVFTLIACKLRFYLSVITFLSNAVISLVFLRFNNSDIYFSVAISIFYPVGCLLIGSYILYVRPVDKKDLSRDVYKKLQFLMSIAWYLKLVEGTIEAPLQFSLTVSDLKCVLLRRSRAGHAFNKTVL